MSAKILVADDHKIVRDGLCSLIQKQPNMEVVAEAENGRVAVKLARRLKPDVIIMDLNMPDLNGIDAARQIVAELPGTKIIVLSMHADKQFVVGALQAGASGYLLKDCAFEELARALHLKDCAFEELARALQTVLKHQTYLSPDIAGTVVKDYLEQMCTIESAIEAALTPREREVLQLIAEGRSTKETAGRLNISIKTVESHRRNIMEKLDIHSTAELTKYAIRTGLTSLDCRPR
jgi:DNA-binding NarL/FixJ family response regulator